MGVYGLEDEKTCVQDEWFNLPSTTLEMGVLYHLVMAH